MNRIKNRFIALLVVFTSILSLFPVGFSGQGVKAATVDSKATTIQVNVTGSATALTARTDATTSEQIYTTKNVTDSFDITVQDMRTSTQDLIDLVKKNSQSASGIIDQKVDIISINGTSNETTEGKAILDTMGIVISDSQNLPNAATERVGKSIKNLPLGVNKIVYKITVTTQTVEYVPAVYEDAAKTVLVSPATYNEKTPVVNAYANQSLTIEHATTYVVNKIYPMTFKAYVGQSSAFDSNDVINDDALNTNNEVPFLYSTEAKPDTNMALRYTFDVPDSISTLKYVMTFDSTMNLENATVYKNGKPAEEGTEYTIDGHNITGNLARLGQSDLIVVKLNSTNNSSDIQKAYAIEIRYNNLSSDKDYSLKEAGITKLDYNDDTTVPAYIGKKFAITEDASGFKVYNGDIYIDSRARMVSLDPTLIRSKSTVAYVVTNNYKDSAGTTRVKKSILKDGKQFVEFMTSSTSNILQVDVYEGSDGNVTDSSKPLARYLLKVNLLTGNEFTMGLQFDNGNSTTFLTQPGVKENVIDEFTTSRRTYDLYCGDPLSVALTGARSSKNEYIRVWLANDINSSNYTEASESVNNELLSDKVSRNTSLDINLGTAKKMMVQAYYDEFETETVNGVEEITLTGSYPIGDKYVFYLPNNYGDVVTPPPGEDSTNSALNSLKIKGYTLLDSDGNEGFLSDKYDYSTTVAKEDTTAKITAIAEDDNVYSIVASINGSSDTYDLISGETNELPLNESGTTTFTIVVTAQDKTTTSTYTVVVKNNPKSSNINLKNVILNVGDYTFDPEEDTTRVRVDQNVTSIKVTPIAEDSKATISVNGQKFSASPITVSLKGNQKTEIEIEVVSEDKTASKTYTLEINRVDSGDWQETPTDGEDPDESDQFYDEYNECWVDLTKYDEWGSINGKPAYFDKKSRQVKDAWISTGGKLYYLNNLGYRASGWKVDKADGKTYYLDTKTGEMRKGWMNLNNSWYYLGLNGVMQKGWLYLNGKWYYFTPNGQMIANQTLTIDGETCRFGQDGAKY